MFLNLCRPVTIALGTAALRAEANRRISLGFSLVAICNARFIKKITQLISDIRCKNFSLKQALDLIGVGRGGERSGPPPPLYWIRQWYLCTYEVGHMYEIDYWEKTSINIDYYSFKIFPQFWLAKSTRIIHHNHLLMTKVGRILGLTRKWRQKCSLLLVNAPLTEKTWGRSWVVFFVKTKMADTSLFSRVRTTAGTRRNNR